MPTSAESRAEYWRAQAADAFTAAVRATDEPTKVLLLSMASVYETLAVKAETADVPSIQRTGTHNVG
jgi:hypothetical protein